MRRVYTAVRWDWVVGCSSLVWPAFLPTDSSAALITYTVDPAQSEFTVSGSLNGLTIASQPVSTIFGQPPPSTLIAGYSGTLTADRDLSANTLQIISGTLSALNNRILPYTPATSYLTAAPGNYGIQAEQTSPPAGDFAAIRSFSVFVSSGLISWPSSFNATLLTASVLSGEFDYSNLSSTLSNPGVFTETDGAASITGDLPLASASAALVDSAGVETLTIPIGTDLDFDAGGLPVELHLSGTIVATATVPEPDALVFAAVPILLSRRNRRESK